MSDERSNKGAASLSRQAAVTGAWVGSALCLVLYLVFDSGNNGYRMSISEMSVDAFLPYLPFLIMLIPLYPIVFFVVSKSIFGQMRGIRNRGNRTVLQFLLVLSLSCLFAVLVVPAVLVGVPALSAVIAAGAVLGALCFWLCAEWINTWRQAGFKRVLFRTAGVACAVLGLGLALALRLTSRGPLYSLCGIIPLLAFVVIGTVVDEIIVMAKEQEPTQVVEGDIQEVGSIVQRGPATYDKLKSLRGQYALILIGIVVFSCLLIVPGQLAIQYRENVLLPAIVISIFSALLCAVVTGIYAQKVGIPRPIIPALSALLPFVPWIALFTVVGYTPTRLKESEPVEDSRSITTKRPIGLLMGFCVGLLPVTVMALLSLVNPRYMGQMFLGPPIGANIPGLPIPCGWPILGMISLGVLLPPASLGLGFYSRLVRREWKLLLVFIVLLQCALPSALLVMLGPAAVQTYKQFFGGHY